MFDITTLTVLADIAERAAKAAGRYMLSVDRNQLTIAIKSGAHSLAAQLFSEVDSTSEAIIYEHLLPTMRSGNIAWLAEESADSEEVSTHERFNKPTFWCVDPLDGTQTFLQGGSGFAVSIALVSQAGVPLLSVVYHPASDTCYRALQGVVIKTPTAVVTPTVFTLFADQSFKQHPFYEHSMVAIEHLAASLGTPDIELVTNQGAVMNACSVLNTPNSVYFKLPKAEAGGGCIWDYASTVGLFNAAGKKVTDMNGELLQLNPKNSLYFNHGGVLFSSNDKVHDAMLEWWRALIVEPLSK